jgi:hypothetical protein
MSVGGTLKLKKHPKAEKTGGDWSHPCSQLRDIFGAACEAWICPKRQALVVLQIPVLSWQKTITTHGSGPCHIRSGWFSTYLDFKKKPAKWNPKMFLLDMFHLIHIDDINWYQSLIVVTIGRSSDVLVQVSPRSCRLAVEVHYNKNQAKHKQCRVVVPFCSIHSIGMYGELPHFELQDPNNSRETL